MMNLAEYRNRNSRLADFLPWVALVGSGIVLNKDGSFQRTARFRGTDLDSAVQAELVAIAGRLNNAFRRLGSGWAIFVEAQRQASNLYPDSRFPDPASALVDAERKADFEEAGDEDVYRKVSSDFAERGVAVEEAVLRAKMKELMATAKEQIMTEVKD